MTKRITYFITTMLVVFGMLASASPVFAHGHGSELKGTIAAIDTTASTVTVTPKKGGADVVLNVDASTRIKRDGKSATLADLQPGDMVEAKYDPATMLASKIEAKIKKSELHGIISAVDTTANTFTVTPHKGGADITLNVDASTMIKRDGKPATLADLQLGDKVEAKYYSSSMIAIKVEARQNWVNLNGTITAVDTTANTVTVTPQKGGADIVLNVDANTIIKRYCAPATLADLLVGDKVHARYNPITFLASKITVDFPELEGVISAVDAVAGTLTVTPHHGGADVTFNVDANTKIELNKTHVTLADLLVGDRVEVQYDTATMLASEIEAKR
jgi:hypothetical protein